MRLIGFFVGLLMSVTCFATGNTELSNERIKELVAAVNDASNRMMLKGSKVEDIDALFSMYTDDFVYIHEIYGGLYTREKLYNNSVKNMKAGRYKMDEGRYKVLNVMTVS